MMASAGRREDQWSKAATILVTEVLVKIVYSRYVVPGYVYTAIEGTNNYSEE
jgi:hypothetical protein